jgi:hypothetical protein
MCVISIPAYVMDTANITTNPPEGEHKPAHPVRSA